MRIKTLLSPIHDPEERYLGPLRANLGKLLSLYEHLLFAASSKTSANTIGFLESSTNVTVVPSNGYTVGARNALDCALSFGDLYHWVDSDRILHWLAAYPEELSGLLENPPRKHYTILGRTERARMTHPSSWVYCEKPCNDLASRRFGLEIDVCVANIVLSRDAIQWILLDSVSTTWGLLTEWPLIVMRHAGKDSLGYIEAEGNEWEDPDYYVQEIASAGGLEAWTSLRYDSEAEWLKRLQNSVDIITPLLK